MKTQLLIVAIFLGIAFQGKARHITGGEMTYDFLGRNGNLYTYQITLKLYRDCFSTGAQLDQQVQFGIFHAGTNALERAVSVQVGHIDQIQLNDAGPCITNPPRVCYQVGYYSTTVDLAGTPDGYIVSFQRCCRVGNIMNVANSSSLGATYMARIPGTSPHPAGPENSNAKFRGKDTVAICANSYFEYDFGAFDSDPQDSLVYEFCDAYIGGVVNNPTPQVPDNPPYNPVPYTGGFDGGAPLGFEVTVDRFTGLVSGIAPYSGIYVVTVCVSEYRDGVRITTSRKDLQIAIADCQTAKASLRPEYVNCDDFTITLENRNVSTLIKTYHWDFGVAGLTNDTSDVERPTFVYGDTGVYRVKLVTNRGLECPDSTYTTVRIFPGFYPEMEVSESCVILPVNFYDRTTTRYGVVNYWQWDFGEPTVVNDTSGMQHPVYKYPTTGLKTVQLIVATNKGCRDTISTVVEMLDRPPLQLINDTLICTIDTLQLWALGTGTIQWTPDYNISSLTSAFPLVSPDVPTKYYITLTTAPGCVAYDSVFVDVRSFVTLTAGKDTSICEGDFAYLNPTGDALYFVWSHPELMDDYRLKRPTARPPATTTFEVIGSIGKCSATAEITVNVVPFPVANAGVGGMICYDSTFQLQGSIVGAFYNWSPINTLTNPTSLRPIARPHETTAYVLTVLDTLGCPKPSYDTVIIEVVPKVIANAGNDTAIVVGQPLQLRATGGETYIWNPPLGLDDPLSQTPVAVLQNSQEYVVKVTTIEGCHNFDTLSVTVYKTEPDIFVPNGFTPNADGHNDVLYAIPVGIESVEYFQIYNRWGKLVFSTNDLSKGWDGRVNGQPQASDSFVWMVRAKDYTGKTIFKKGTVVLIR